MKETKLSDGTQVYCLQATEAKVLDGHIEGYFKHGITLNKGDVVIDAGANIGIFGLRASQKINNLVVHCIEPVPSIFRVLKANARRSNNPNFNTSQIGLGRENSTVEFTYYPNAPALSTADPGLWNDDKNSFSRAIKGSLKNAPKGMRWMRFIPSFMIPLIGWNLTRGKVKVNAEVMTLSHFITLKGLKKVDLLKIDCEGKEWDILRGVEEQDWSKINSIVVEVHNIDNRLANIQELLFAQGFYHQIVEKEAAMKEINLSNLYATR